MANHWPEELRLSRDKTMLTVTFPDIVFQLPAEYLRVSSPSAEVRGHGPGQAITVSGKRNVAIFAHRTCWSLCRKTHFRRPACQRHLHLELPPRAGAGSKNTLGILYCRNYQQKSVTGSTCLRLNYPLAGIRGQFDLFRIRTATLRG